MAGSLRRGRAPGRGADGCRIATAAVQLSVVPAQCILFGQKADDLQGRPIVDDGELLALGRFKQARRLADVHLGQQHILGIQRQLCNGLDIDLWPMCVSHQDDAGITADLVDERDTLTTPERKHPTKL